MFRAIEFSPRHPPEAVVGAGHVGPPPEGHVRWIDVESPTDAELSLLGNRFGFHPLELEDCAHFDQRPKLEEYEDHIFVVTHSFTLPSRRDAEPDVLELHSFLGRNYLVTVHSGPLPPLNSAWDRLKIDGTAAGRGADFIRYLVADAMVDAIFPVVDQLATDIESLEDRLLGARLDESVLEEILRLKRLLISLRRLLPSQRDVLAQLAKRDFADVSGKTAPYFRDVHDHLLRLNESVEANRELLGNVLDAYQWTVSQRTNEIVKRLTIVSAVFLPLTFITGFFGQNFEDLPFESSELMVAMLASCLIVPAGMLWFFLRSKWF